MKFEVSERVSARVDKDRLLHVIQNQFHRVSKKVARRGDICEVRNIEATFGSINRTDSTIVELRPKEGGFLLVASVDYRPSGMFWVFFILGLPLLSLVPTLFYLVQKKNVRSAIEAVFTRVRHEFQAASVGAASVSRLDAHLSAFDVFPSESS